MPKEPFSNKLKKGEILPEWRDHLLAIICCDVRQFVTQHCPWWKDGWLTCQTRAANKK
jgi:hypothetical protein